MKQIFEDHQMIEMIKEVSPSLHFSSPWGLEDELPPFPFKKIPWSTFSLGSIFFFDKPIRIGDDIVLQ
jgi:hypothetical protein